VLGPQDGQPACPQSSASSILGLYKPQTAWSTSPQLELSTRYWLPWWCMMPYVLRICRIRVCKSWHLANSPQILTCCMWLLKFFAAPNILNLHKEMRWAFVGAHFHECVCVRESHKLPRAKFGLNLLCGRSQEKNKTKHLQPKPYMPYGSKTLDVNPTLPFCMITLVTSLMG
jgi:hypothetical protein